MFAEDWRKTQRYRWIYTYIIGSVCFTKHHYLFYFFAIVGQRVVVVTHGGLIRALHRRATTHHRVGKVVNTSVNVFHLSDGGKWTIKTWGDVSHLSKTGFLKSGFGGDSNSG